MKLKALPVHSFEDATIDFEQIQAQGFYSGTGAPTMVTGQPSLYFRKDTLGTVNQRIYVSAGTGTWTGIL